MSNLLTVSLECFSSLFFFYSLLLVCSFFSSFLPVCCSFSCVHFFFFSFRFFFSCPSWFEVLYSVSDSIFGRFYDRLFRLDTMAWWHTWPQAPNRIILHSNNYDTYMHAETVNTIMTSIHTSLEKYTSHTLFEMVAKWLRKGCVWEVSWRLNKLQHIDPQFLCL